MWNELSMADRARYIQMGVRNGITSLDTIRSVYNEYAKNKFDEGGYKEDKILTTGNDYADMALGFVPFVGTAMDLEDAIREPSMYTIGKTAISLAGDLLGASLIKGAVKATKAAKAAKVASGLTTRAFVKEAFTDMGKSSLRSNLTEATDAIKTLGPYVPSLMDSELETLEVIEKLKEKHRDKKSQ